MLLCSAGVAWLIALAPVGRLGKAIAHVVALAVGVECVSYSRQLVLQQSRRGAMAAMNQELEAVDLALQAYSQEQALRELYGVDGTYSPEVREELEKSLEHLYNNSPSESPTQTSTSTSRKNLYIAIVSLMEAGKSETFIVEEILQCKGRRFKEGQRTLQDLLQEGRENEW